MVADPEILGLGEWPLGQTALGGWGFSAISEPLATVGERFIDPSKGDYANANGQILRTSATKQRVINLLVNRFGSSLAIRGLRFPEVHDENTERFMDGEIRTALRPLLDEGAIIIKRIYARPEGRVGRLGINVDFVDTQTGRTETAET